MNAAPGNAAGGCVVPARYWKVLVILPWGGNDLARINTGTRVIAVDMPNTQTEIVLDWHQYRTSVVAIEASTGLNLFGRIPTTVQNNLEGGVDSRPTE
jgi:endonuclease G